MEGRGGARPLSWLPRGGRLCRGGGEAVRRAGVGGRGLRSDQLCHRAFAGREQRPPAHRVGPGSRMHAAVLGPASHPAGRGEAPRCAHGVPRVRPVLRGEMVRHAGERRGRSGNSGEAVAWPCGQHRRTPHVRAEGALGPLAAHTAQSLLCFHGANNNVKEQSLCSQALTESNTWLFEITPHSLALYVYGRVRR